MSPQSPPHVLEGFASQEAEEYLEQMIMEDELSDARIGSMPQPDLGNGVMGGEEEEEEVLVSGSLEEVMREQARGR